MIGLGPRVAFGIVTLAVATLLAGCGAGAPADGSESATPSGQALYVRHCQSCHGVAATGAGRVGNAPSHGPTGHTWHHPDSQLVDTVLGRFNYPGRKMPSFEGRLFEEEVMSIIAYIKEGWTDEQRAAQAEITQAYREARR